LNARPGDTTVLPSSSSGSGDTNGVSFHLQDGEQNGEHHSWAEPILEQSEESAAGVLMTGSPSDEDTPPSPKRIRSEVHRENGSECGSLSFPSVRTLGSIDYFLDSRTRGWVLVPVSRDAFLYAFRLPNSISPDNHCFPFCLPANLRFLLVSV
jgi:hypothetical protein